MDGRLHTTTVDGGSMGDGKVKLCVLQRFRETGREARRDLRHARGSADQEDLVDTQPGHFSLGSIQGPLDNVERLFQKVTGRHLKLLPGHVDDALYTSVTAAQARIRLLAQGFFWRFQHHS